VTSVADSLLAQTSKLSLITQEGPEITFPKTKSVSACVATLMRLGLALARPEDTTAQQRLEKLNHLSADMKAFIESIEPHCWRSCPK
jgi:glucosamine 6-phosphate synthetase-like amidotransferase/phosphosugar isomerase protein